MSNITVAQYYGSFVNQKGETWRVEMLPGGTELDTDTATEIKFDADAPLDIEWEEHDKHEPIQGATLTIKAERPQDYAFAYNAMQPDTYVKVYRNGALFWTGIADGESYEEPYQRNDEAIVTLTFTDFGQWKRIKQAVPRQVMSVRELITIALNEIGIEPNALKVVASYYSCQYTAQWGDGTWVQGNELQDVCIDSSNLYNSDGEAVSLYDAIDKVLTPLGIRIVQRAGVVVVYDLNALYNHLNYTTADEQITWDSDEQTLLLDKVVDTYSVKFSPNGKSELLKAELDEEIKKAEKNPTTYTIQSLNSLGRKNDSPDYYQSFKFVHLNQGCTQHTLAAIHPKACIFTTIPLAGNAEEHTGIAWNAIVNQCENTNFATSSSSSDKETPQGIDNRNGGGYADTANPLLFRMPDVWCPANSQYVSGEDRYSQRYLQLKMDLLIDPRYNPMEEASNYNEKEQYEKLKAHIKLAYIPYSLTLLDANKKPIYRYVSQLITTTTEHVGGTTTQSYYKTAWEKIDNTTTPTETKNYLAYYSHSKLKSCNDGSALTGWQTNNPKEPFCLYAERHSEDTEYSKAFPTNGELIPLPPVAGYLRLTIYNGIMAFTSILDKQTSDCFHPESASELSKDFATIVRTENVLLRYFLYKLPELNIVKGIKCDTTDIPDTTYEATVYAKNRGGDDISLDTDFGTDVELTSMQRGTFRTADNHRLLLRRTNTQAPWTIETDLLNMLISQYRQRCIMLKGECVTPTQPLTTFTDRAMPSSSRFIIKSEVLDAIKGTSTITFVELKEETFNPQNFK